mmetsp:Transcript_20713/g.53510  ORF Transcript_20713/g.53510 Transcript_20713/m.53510 type:complete len:386 (-) Transcript_20713:513-1670(-)
MSRISWPMMPIEYSTSRAASSSANACTASAARVCVDAFSDERMPTIDETEVTSESRARRWPGSAASSAMEVATSCWTASVPTLSATSSAAKPPMLYTCLHWPRTTLASASVARRLASGAPVPSSILVSDVTAPVASMARAAESSCPERMPSAYTAFICTSSVGEWSNEASTCVASAAPTACANGAHCASWPISIAACAWMPASRPLSRVTSPRAPPTCSSCVPASDGSAAPMLHSAVSTMCCVESSDEENSNSSPSRIGTPAAASDGMAASTKERLAMAERAQRDTSEERWPSWPPSACAAPSSASVARNRSSDAKCATACTAAPASSGSAPSSATSCGSAPCAKSVSRARASFAMPAIAIAACACITPPERRRRVTRCFEADGS